jgi:hypothetical protein
MCSLGEEKEKAVKLAIEAMEKIEEEINADFRPTNISCHHFMDEQLSQSPDHQGKHTT